MFDYRCAFLTMQDTTGWSIDADMAFPPLAERGWRCEWLPWRTPGIDWDRWDAVFPAATWDYPDDPEAFLRVLKDVDRSSAILVNDLELVRWNIPKTYLRDLEAGGAAIVPSRWYDRYADLDLSAALDALGGAIVIKPVISSNADRTYLLETPVAADVERELSAAFAQRAFLVQPFIDSIRTEGELSLFYVGGAFSHAIRKVPKTGDFRVQEEHGADIRAVDPGATLVACADRVLSLVTPTPLYARCDFVRDAAGVHRLMELELIEPSLYLRMDEGAAERFAAAFDRHLRARMGVGQ